MTETSECCSLYIRMYPSTVSPLLTEDDGEFRSDDGEFRSMEMISGRMQCLLILVLAMAAISTCRAEVPHPIKWSLTAIASTLPLRKGSQVQATLRAHIPPGWHLYAMDQ